MDKKSLLALSWNIATNPKLYWELVLNPYSDHTQKIISIRFPNQNSVDIIKAVILAEPEGKYDRHFKQLSKLQQEEELERQKEISIELNIRLSQYGERYAKEFGQLPNEFVYSNLFLLIFESNNLNEIEKKYTQNQRRDLKLSIVNFIEKKQENTNGLSLTIGIFDLKFSFAQPLLMVFFAILSFMLLFYFAQGQIQNTPLRFDTKKNVLGIEIQKKSRGLPLRLKIPSVNIDADIEHIGLTSEGAMDVPSNTTNVGWYKPGVPSG